MNKPCDEIEDIEQIAEKAERGEDISEYFTGHYVVKQRISIDFSVSLLKLIDAECQRMGMTRQTWIKLACEERLQQGNKNGLAVDISVSSAPHR